jgi:predicted esterase
MKASRAWLWFASCSLVAVSWRLAPEAAAKGNPRAKEPPKTGVFRLDVVGAPFQYIQMAVPKDYDPAKWAPLVFFLANDAQSVDTWVAAWGESLPDKGWIVASPVIDTWDNAESIEPLKKALEEVKSRYHVDDRRFVLAGHAAGANMAWCLAASDPATWTAILAMNGEVPAPAQPGLKGLAGKPVYLFSGDKDSYYTKEMVEKDKKLLDYAKVKLTVEAKKDWASDFPRTSVFAITQWLGTIWPPGAYREKADLVEKALEAKDLAGAVAALKDLNAELRRSPYPAFESRAAGYEKAAQDLGRGLLADAKALLAADALAALEKTEAAVKAVKGLGPVEKEAAAALAALKKDPAVLAAQKRKENEVLAVGYMEKGMAAEAKADGPKALEWYRKVVALGETSKKDEAAKRISEIESTLGGK